MVPCIRHLMMSSLRSGPLSFHRSQSRMPHRASAPAGALDRWSFVKDCCLWAEAMLFGSQPFIADMTAEALSRPSQAAATMRASFKRRGRSDPMTIGNSPMIECHQPAAGMFLLADIRKTGQSGEAFALGLLEEEKVAVMPVRLSARKSTASFASPDGCRRSDCRSQQADQTPCREVWGVDDGAKDSRRTSCGIARAARRGHGVRHSRVHTIELYRGLGSSKIRHVTPRHEQGAGFMADGYARASGKPGVAFVITGPGLTNTITRWRKRNWTAFRCW